MARGILIVLLYLRQFFLARLEYKWDFLFSLLASMVSAVMGLVFIILVLDGAGAHDLAGWSKDEVLFIYGYAGIAVALFSILSPNLYGFGDKYIIQGQFDRVLLRPLGSLTQVLSETFNLDAIGNLIVGVTILLVAKARLGLQFSFSDYLWLAASGVFGAAILLSVFVILASLSFHFEDRLGISAPFYNLIQFGRYPITVFNKVIQVLLSVIVPFAFVGFYPSTYFISKEGLQHVYLLTPVVAGVAMMTAWLFWRWGVRNYSSTGN